MNQDGPPWPEVDPTPLHSPYEFERAWEDEDNAAEEAEEAETTATSDEKAGQPPEGDPK